MAVIERSNVQLSGINADSGEINQCPFCVRQLSRSRSAFDTVLASGPGLSIVPALGMLVPGYLLAVSSSHVLSMADSPIEQIQEQALWIDKVIGSLAPKFGPYFTFEHGSCSASRSGACIDHAHVHLVPLARELGNQLKSMQDWNLLTSIADLKGVAGQPYAYLSVDNQRFVISNPQLPSQWIRQVIAQSLGHDRWDWAIDFGDDNLAETLRNVESIALLDRGGALVGA